MTNNSGLGEWTKADIERFYERAAAAGVYAPLDPGELDSMEERFAGIGVWHEPKRDAQRFITLTRPWLGVVLEQTSVRGGPVPVEPGTLRVVDVGTDRFIVRDPRYGDVALVHAL